MLYRVKALPDRLARVSPGGAIIPHNAEIVVELTPRIYRMAENGDVVIEPYVEESDEAVVAGARARARAESGPASTAEQADS